MRKMDGRGVSLATVGPNDPNDAATSLCRRV
jgi:hypothetical protein